MITKQSLQAVRRDIDKALAIVGKHHDLAINLGNITYTGSSFKGKIEAISTEESKTGLATDFDQLAFNKHCAMFGLTPQMFGRAFRNVNGYYEICGIKPQNTKYPIIAKNRMGKKFKFTSEAVIRGLRE